MAKMNSYLLSQTLVLPWHSLILVNSILLVVEAKNLEITLDYSFSCLPTKTIQPHLIASPLVLPWTKPSMCVPYIIPDSFLTGLLDSTLISLQSVLNKVDKIIPLNLKANPISFFCSKPFFLQQPRRTCCSSASRSGHASQEAMPRKGSRLKKKKYIYIYIFFKALCNPAPCYHSDFIS